jgi:hypothetical protein
LEDKKVADDDRVNWYVQYGILKDPLLFSIFKQHSCKVQEYVGVRFDNSLPWSIRTNLTVKTIQPLAQFLLLHVPREQYPLLCVMDAGQHSSLLLLKILANYSLQGGEDFFAFCGLRKEH